MTDSAEMKRMSEVAEWLNAKEGYDWARSTFAAIRYGNERTADGVPSSYGFYSLKFTDDDRSGSEGDFTYPMWWGALPGDKALERMNQYGIRTTVVLLHNRTPRYPGRDSSGVAASNEELHRMFAVTVQPGDTLSQISSEHGVSLAAVEQANPGITDPNVIYAGENVVVPVGGSWTPYSAPQSPVAASAPVQASVVPQSAPAPSAGGIDDIPGVPSSFVQCVAFRESTNGTNQAEDGGTYGIINASGYHVNGQSLGAQKQAFKAIYDTTGPSAWSADGCPGT